MISTVIFDIGGVLHSSYRAVGKDLMRELGINQDAIDSIWRTHIPKLGSGKIDEGEFWTRVSKDHGIRSVSLDENLLGRAFTSALAPNLGVVRIVKKLRKMGLKLAALSDTIEPHAKAVKAVGLYDLFDYVFLSHKTGYRKPDSKAFRSALNEIGAQPNEVIFIDDSPINADAATKIGLHGITYTTDTKLRSELGLLIPNFK